MQWLADYWWIILILLVGMILNGIKELRRLDHKRFWTINRSYRPTVTIMPSGMMKMTGRIKIRKSKQAANNIPCGATALFTN